MCLNVSGFFDLQTWLRLSNMIGKHTWQILVIAKRIWTWNPLSHEENKETAHCMPLGNLWLCLHMFAEIERLCILKVGIHANIDQISLRLIWSRESPWRQFPDCYIHQPLPAWVWTEIDSFQPWDKLEMSYSWLILHIFYILYPLYLPYPPSTLANVLPSIWSILDQSRGHARTSRWEVELTLVGQSWDRSYADSW